MPHPNTSLPLPARRTAPAHVRCLEIFLTNQCNMSCVHCAALCAKKAAEVKVIEWKDLKAGIDSFMDPHGTPYRGQKAIALAGGEPFAVFPLVLKAAQYAHGLQPRPALILFTNGTLATPEKVRKLRSLGVTIIFSLDGDKTGNDLFRKFRGGKASAYDAVMKNLEKLPSKEGLATNTVLRPGNLDGTLKALDRFAAMGFKSCDLWIDYFHLWTDDELRRLEAFMQSFTDYYVRRTKEEGRLPFYVEMIHHALYNAVFLERGKAWWDKCFRLILGADGNYYDCQGIYAFPYGRAASSVINRAVDSRGADWKARETYMEKAAGMLKKLKVDKDWQHVCPRCYYKVLDLMGKPEDLPAMMENLHKVSRVFMGALVDAASRLRSERSFVEAYIEQPMYGATPDELGLPAKEVRALLLKLLPNKS